MKIYFAAPFTLGPYVLKLHDLARELGHEPTSTWASEASGEPDTLDELADGRRLALMVQNDADVERADLLVAIVVSGLGKEMFCEATLARFRGLPIYWVGPERALPLSAFRPGSTRMPDDTHLKARLRDLAGPDGVERLHASVTAH